MKKRKIDYSKKRKKSTPAVREPVAAPATETGTAKIFWNGRSQAVRLPLEFRFDGDEVAIRRNGDAVILEPLRPRRGWPAGFWERLGVLGDDFEAAVREGRHVVESAPPDLGAL